MNQVFDTHAAKKPTNLSINSDLLGKARALKINLSATLEQALTELVNTKQRELWKAQNKAAIDAYNQMVENHGVFSDEDRMF